MQRINVLKSIGDSTTASNEAYELQTGKPWFKHNAIDYLPRYGNLKQYVDQFLTQDVSLIITIELGVT